MKSISQSQEERTFAEVKRMSHAVLDGLELLRRTAQALRRTIPFSAYCGNMADPASRLMTRAIASRVSACAHVPVGGSQCMPI